VRLPSTAGILATGPRSIGMATGSPANSGPRFYVMQVRRWVLLGAVLALVLLVGAAAFTVRGMPAATSGSLPSPATASLPQSTAMAAGDRAPTPTPTLAPTAATDLRFAIQSLQVADEHRAGYSRDLFPHWIDADGDACNTRKEVLLADALAPPARSGACSLTGGEWVSLYDGAELHDPTDVEIDHVVALAEAWDSGAYGWAEDERTAFSNDLADPPELLPVSHATNSEKGDKDPADWLPPLESSQCQYLTDYVAVKARWHLSVDERELAALNGVASECS